MAKRRRKTSAKKTGCTTPPPYDMVTFLPDYLDQVKAIAMQGSSDREMAKMFAIKPSLIKKWKEQYPSFEEAIRKGRTLADARVTQALFERAVGYEHAEDKIFCDKGDIIVHQTTKHYPPDVGAIKYWMGNRSKESKQPWSDAQHHQVSGKGGEPPVGIRDETKQEVVASILALIQSKSDPKTDRK